MSPITFYFNAGVVAGGIYVIGWMIRQIYLTLRKGSIARRPALTPLTPRDHPGVYWSLIVFLALSTIGIAWGVAVTISRLIDL
jgi:hypothetical protein